MNEQEPTHLDICSGIGGFAVAAQCAGFRTIAFVEKDRYCQGILAQTWPSIPVYPDIYQFGGRPFRGSNLLTAGFPCQPYSHSGKRRGSEDDRYLWPEVLRVIQTVQPTWVLGENVDGLDGLGLDDCISDLEASGYEVAPPLEIPACAVSAIHERNRIWIIANLNPKGLDSGRSNRGPRQILRDEQRNSAEGESERNRRESFVTASAETTSNTSPLGWDARNLLEASREWRALLEPGRRIGDGVSSQWGPTPEWFEREPGLGRLVHGIPNRTHRLEALGNAIVPQVAFQIIKEIRKLI